MSTKETKAKTVKAKKPKTDELTELRNQLLRTQADFDNYRKRTQKEKETFGQFLNTDLILRFIPVLDNFRLALKHLPKELEGNEWVQGIWHIERQLEQVLTDEGVTEIKSIGEVYDHNLHEAIEEVESEVPPGTVTEEIVRGYKQGDRVIRSAKVKISKNKIEKKKE